MRARLEILVVGIGNLVLMKALSETEKRFRAKGITLIAEKMKGAHKVHNKLSKSEKVIGVFNLT